MPNLGDAFPPEIRKQAADRNLKPGAVIRVQVGYTKPPKIKFLLIACIEPKVRVFLINSEVNQYALDRPRLAKCHVKLEETDYDFLEHDSFADCVDTNDTHDLSDLRDELEGRFGEIYKGQLLEKDIHRVVQAVNDSPTMTSSKKQEITESLKSVI